MNRVLVVTTEPLPLPGRPATGAGLRAWGLAQGLRAGGLDVRLLMPRDADATFGGGERAPTATDPDWIVRFDRTRLTERVAAENPDVIVMQHWGLMRELGEVDCPLAIDLAGPHLLERRFWGSRTPEADLSEKLDALRRADYLTAGGTRQRLYFLPFLAMAGWAMEDPDLLPVIPFSFKAAEDIPPLRAGRLIYGGFFLPWQDPAPAIETALDVLDRSGAGELVFVGGAHPSLDVSRGRFEPLLNRLTAHPRVRTLGPMSFDDYWALLREGGVALDLMRRNAERELAFTTRTVVYLAAGLPVIHDNYSELGAAIARTGAGWSVDPDNRDGLAGLLEHLIGGRLELGSHCHAALELLRSELDWEQTVEPLALFCHQPFLRKDKTATRLAFEERDRRLTEAETELEGQQRELSTLLGKRWVRWGLALTSGRGWLRLPMALLAGLIALGLAPVFLINDALAKRPARH